MGTIWTILRSPATFSIQDIWLHLTVAAVLVALAVYTWFYRQQRGGLMAVLAFANAAAELLIAVGIAAEQSVPGKFLGFKILHLSMIPLSTIWLVMVIQISGRGRWLKRPVIALLVGMLACSWLAVLTNDWLGLYWRDLVWDGERLRFLRGPAYLFGLFYNYIHIVLAFILNLKWAMSSSGLRRWQALSVLVAPLFGVAGNILWNLEQSFLGLAPTPTGFLVMGLMAVWGFSRFKLFSLVSQAQASVTAGTRDGVVIIDDQDYIVELNPVAYRACSRYSPKPVGSKFQTVFAFWPQLAALAASPAATTAESELAHDGVRKYYELKVSLLYGDNNSLLGKVIVARDISEQKKAQAQILEQQKALSIMAERDRLGRELHDGSGQLWSYINMQVEAVRSQLARKDAAQADMLLQRLAKVVREAHVDIRESIAGLKEGASAEQGLWQSLEDYFQWFSQNNDIDAELTIDKEFTAGVLPPTTEVQLLRIIQEALTNIRKHAAARHVKVFVSRRGETTEVRIEDDGRGFDVEKAARRKGCYGIGIMQERAEEVGAQLRIESAPHAGTAVVVSVPLAGDGLRRQGLP